MLLLSTNDSRVAYSFNSELMRRKCDSCFSIRVNVI